MAYTSHFDRIIIMMMMMMMMMMKVKVVDEIKSSMTKVLTALQGVADEFCPPLLLTVACRLSFFLFRPTS